MAFRFPDIDPVAFSLGPVSVRWYALAYMVGILLGWRYCMRLAAKDSGVKPDPDDMDDYLTWAVLGIILGGRLGYVFFYEPSVFMADPAQIFMIWKGGMSFHGGMIGVLISMFIFSYYRKIPLLRLTDIICAAAPIGLFFGRLANFVNAELYGRFTDLPWGVIFPDGSELARHPSQLYEAALEGVVLFIILAVLIQKPKVRNRPGLVSGAFLLGYGTFRGLVEFVREPDAQIGLIGGVITMGQILCLPMILGGFALIVYSLRKDVDLSPPPLAGEPSGDDDNNSSSTSSSSSLKDTVNL